MTQNQNQNRSDSVIAVQPEDLERGDTFLLNDRTIPCGVRFTSEMDRYDGAIKVEYLVVARGPCGGELWLQRTSTGRIRVKESPPYGAYANVYRLERASRSGAEETGEQV